MGIKMDLWKRFYNLLKGYRLTYVFLYLTKLSYMVLKMLMPLVLATFVDEVLYHHNVEMVGRLVLLYIVLFIAFVILSGCDVVIWQFLSNYLVVSVKNRIWGKILKLKMDEFGRYEYADLVNIVNDDARAFVRLINQNILPFVNAVTTATVSIFIIYRFNVFIGIFTLVVMPVMVLANKKWICKLRTLSKEARLKKLEVTGYLLDSFSHFRDIRLLGAEIFFQNKIEGSIREYNEMDNKIQIGMQTADEKLKLVSTFSKIAIWVFIALAYFKGVITLGGYVAVSQYITYAYDAFSTIFNFNFQINQRRINLDKIFTLLDAQEENLDTGEEVKELDGGICFHNVSFGYVPDAKVLEDVSFTVELGKLTGLVGKNGAGKSTVIALIMGLYEPDGGKINVGGRDARTFSLRSLRQKICIIMQHEAVPEASVADYIRTYEPELTDGQISARLSGMDFCTFLMEGEDISQRRMGGLSGGQTQCVKIAAALMREASILILDEPTSNVDRETEAKIFAALGAHKKGRIILAVTHGEHYRGYFDEVIHL